MTMARVSPSATRSMTRTTFGFLIEVRICRSCMNRATASGSDTSSGLSTLIATRSPVSRTVPANTWPIAPRPSVSCSTYRLPSDWSTLLPWFPCRSGLTVVGCHASSGTCAAVTRPSAIRAAAQLQAAGEDRGGQPQPKRATVSRAGRLQDEPAAAPAELQNQPAGNGHAVGGSRGHQPAVTVPDSPVPRGQLITDRRTSQQLSIVHDDAHRPRLPQHRPESRRRLRVGPGDVQPHRRAVDRPGERGTPGRDKNQRGLGGRQRCRLNGQGRAAAGAGRPDDQEPGGRDPDLAEFVATDPDQNTVTLAGQGQRLRHRDGCGQRVHPERRPGRRADPRGQLDAGPDSQRCPGPARSAWRSAAGLHRAA